MRLLAGFAALLLFGSAASACAADVAITVHEAHGVYRVRGEFRVDIPNAAVWAVLTDYDHIGDFVQSVKTSAVETGVDGTRVLHQEAVVGFFPVRWSAHVALVLHEDARRRIAFRDTLAREFQDYAGEWVLAADSTGTIVRYALDARPRQGAPHVIARGMMSHAARDLLIQVRAEMVRRGSQPLPD